MEAITMSSAVVYLQHRQGSEAQRDGNGKSTEETWINPVPHHPMAMEEGPSSVMLLSSYQRLSLNNVSVALFTARALSLPPTASHDNSDLMKCNVQGVAHAALQTFSTLHASDSR